MLDPKLIKDLLGKGGPVVAETQRLLKDPNTPIRSKVQLLSTLALPEFRKLKNDPSVAMMLPMLVAMGVESAKVQFKSMPKEQIVDPIDAQLSQVPAELVGPLLKAERDTLLAKVEAAEKNPEPKEKTAEQKENEAIEAYLEEIFTELSEDEYVDFSMTIAKAVPSRLFNVFSEGQTMDELEAKARKAFRDHKTDKDGVKAEAELKQQAIRGLILSEEVFDGLAEAFTKVSGEKVYALAEEVVDNIKVEDIVAIAENGLVAVEDALNAAKEDGNPLRVKNPEAAQEVVAAFGRVAQVVEDAIVNADILPELDLVELYKAQKAVAVVNSVELPDAPKGPKGPK
jgi:hypothetical protein